MQIYYDPITGLYLSGTIAEAELADGAVTSAKILDGTIVHGDVATANKDGTAATPSLRTLGTGAAQACAGNDARLTGTPRIQLCITAQGIISETFSRNANGAGSILIDGYAYFVAIGLKAGDVVTNISVVVNTVGATVTLSKVGLYSTAGTRLAVSADQGAAWESTGMKTIAMGTPYTVLTDGAYYVAVVCKATTLPYLIRGATQTYSYLKVGTGIYPYGIQTGQTDLPASATIGGGGLGIWAGIS
jgi:hypothetical protein